jgi:hypothetical protein
MADHQCPTPIILATQEAKMKRIAVPTAQAKRETISKLPNTQKKGLVECLPNNEALGSNCSTDKNKK